MSTSSYLAFHFFIAIYGCFANNNHKKARYIAVSKRKTVFSLNCNKINPFLNKFSIKGGASATDVHSETIIASNLIDTSKENSTEYDVTNNEKIDLNNSAIDNASISSPSFEEQTKESNFDNQQEKDLTTSENAEIMEDGNEKETIYDDKNISISKSIFHFSEKADPQNSTELETKDNLMNDSHNAENINTTAQDQSQEIPSLNEKTAINESMPSTSPAALELRVRGKEYHDEGNLTEAIKCYKEAIKLIKEEKEEELNENSRGNSDEMGTCYLHIALCQLKLKKYKKCINSCNQLLSLFQDTSKNSDFSNALKGRAYYRRAKAYLALERKQEALEDAKVAAMMGDTKSISFYGRLLREIRDREGNNDSSSSLSNMPNPLLNNLLPTDSSTSGSTSGLDTMLWDILQKSTMPENSPVSSSSSAPKGASDSLVKSIMKSITKVLSNEETQETICSTLGQVQPNQIQQMASMVTGMTLPLSQAESITNVLHSITPSKMQWCIKWGNRGYKSFITFKKIVEFWNQYFKTVFFYALAFFWVFNCRLDVLESFEEVFKR